MPKEGFCSECDEDVALTEDGGCENGHGPECVTDVHEAEPDTSEDEAVEEASDDEPAGKSRRTGLIVTIVLLVLWTAFLSVFVATRTGALSSLTFNMRILPPPPADRSSQMQTAIGFAKARYVGDYLALKQYLTPAAQNAITEGDWRTIDEKGMKPESSTFGRALGSETTSVTIEYSGVFKKTGAVKGLMSFDLPSVEATRVTFTQTSNGTPDSEIIDLERASDGTWYVVGSDYRGTFQPWDAAFVRGVLKQAKGL
jgi:hypothetical protein